MLDGLTSRMPTMELTALARIMLTLLRFVMVAHWLGLGWFAPRSLCLRAAASPHPPPPPHPSRAPSALFSRAPRLLPLPPTPRARFPASAADSAAPRYAIAILPLEGSPVVEDDGEDWYWEDEETGQLCVPWSNHVTTLCRVYAAGAMSLQVHVLALLGALGHDCDQGIA